MINNSVDDKRIIKHLKDEVAFLRTALHSIQLRTELLKHEKMQVLNADCCRAEIKKIEGMK